MQYFTTNRLRGEPAFSWIERSAKLNRCCDGMQLLDDLGIDQRKLRMGDEAALLRVSEKFVIPLEDLQRDTPALNTVTRVWTVNGETLDEQHLRLADPAICESCASDQPNGAILLQDCLTMVTCCADHKTLRRTGSDSIGLVTTTLAAQYFLGRLDLWSGAHIEAPLLDGMSFRAAARAILFVGVRLLGLVRVSAIPFASLHGVYERGFSACRSRENLLSALDEILELVPAAKEIGAVRGYGDGILSLTAPKIIQEVGDFARLLQLHAADHLPGRSEHETATVRGADVRTIVSASKELDIHPKTLAKVVRTYEQKPFFERHRLVSAPVMADLRERLAITYNQEEMFAAYGLTVLPGKECVKAGLISPVYPSARHQRIYSRRDLIQMLDRLATDAPVVPTCPQHLSSIADAGSAIRRSFASILAKIVSGELTVEARGPELGFDSLYVDRLKVRTAIVGGGQMSGITRRECERRLRTTGRVVDALLLAGRLSAAQERSPIPRKNRISIIVDSIEAFERDCVMSWEVI